MNTYKRMIKKFRKEEEDYWRNGSWFCDGGKKESHRDEVPGGTNRGERSEGGTAPTQNF